MSDLEELLAEYDQWQYERREIAEAEDQGAALPKDWEASDDEGIELLHRLAAAVRP